MDQLAKLVSRRLKAQPAPGPHPAPELLAAFAEHALPDGERRQLLQHLGACSDCREILYVALPDSSDAQQVLVLKPRTFRRWGLSWGALVASVAIVAVFFSTNRLGHKNHAAPIVATAPAGASETETKIAAEKTPPELYQVQSARDASKTRLAGNREESESKPRPEAKHMTAKPQAVLDFGGADQVRVSAPPASDQTMNSSRQNLPLQGRNVTSLSEFTASQAKPTAAPQPAGKDKNTMESAYASGGLLARESAVTGNLGGVISDPSGAVVGNANVTMVGPLGTKSATSDSEGRFSFDLLTPGSYSLKAEASGFKATEIEHVAVLNNRTSNLQVRLEPGAASEVVEVSAAAPTVAQAVEASGGAPELGTSAGLVAERQKKAAQFIVPKSPQPGIGSGAGGSKLQWTLSPQGAVQRSSDNGKTWQAVSVVIGTTFRALSAVGANIWVGGRSGALYHSPDSGQTWAKFEPAAGGKKLDQDIVHVDFSDPLSGTVTTANGEVWTTSDGGQNWLPHLAH